MRRRTVRIATAAGVAAACCSVCPWGGAAGRAQQQGARGTPPRRVTERAPKPLPVYVALEIAVRKGKIGERKPYRLEARRGKEGNAWLFLFTALPEKPGAHTTIEVTDRREVEVMPGF